LTRPQHPWRDDGASGVQNQVRFLGASTGVGGYALIGNGGVRIRWGSGAFGRESRRAKLHGRSRSVYSALWIGKNCGFRERGIAVPRVGGCRERRGFNARLGKKESQSHYAIPVRIRIWPADCLIDCDEGRRVRCSAAAIAGRRLGIPLHWHLGRACRATPG